VSHPAGLPDLFVDRSLGRLKVAVLLRAEGFRLVTLAEHDGMPADERVEDEDWLQLAGTRRWLAVMKDDRIRYKPSERAALVTYGVRGLVITNANLSAEVMVERIIRVLPTAAEICVARSGPFLFAVQKNGLREIDLAS